jgi:hypothetical protein
MVVMHTTGLHTTHTYIHTYKHAHVHTHIQIHIQACMHP